MGVLDAVDNPIVLIRGYGGNHPTILGQTEILRAELITTNRENMKSSEAQRVRILEADIRNNRQQLIPQVGIFSIRYEIDDDARKIGQTYFLLSALPFRK